MQKMIRFLGAASLLACGAAYAGKYQDTITLFKNAGESADYFSQSYAYAVFPTIGEGAFIAGAAAGKGHVYVHHAMTGDTTLKQLSVGFQAGGKAYSEIIFFKDKRALDQFESGSFEFSAGASAIAVTASAGASAGTNGLTAGASAGKKDATTEGRWNDGMAVFTIAKGGLMYAAAIAGQRFTYSPRGSGSPGM